MRFKMIFHVRGYC